jgi:hypothetical protein
VNINTNTSQESLEEMCRRVGVDHLEFDFGQPEWYRLQPWTTAEEEDFRVWLGQQLKKWKYFRGKYRGQDRGYYEAGKLIMNYGWMIKDEPQEEKKTE